MKRFNSLLLIVFMAVAGFAAKAETLAFITTTSTGYVWAYDGNGNYYDTWPGKPISELPKATYQGKLYYVVAYTHFYADSPKLIFSDGTNQTEAISVLPNTIFDYNGGTTYNIVDPNRSYTVAGAPAALFDYEWSNTYGGNDMRFLYGLYTWQKQGVVLPACDIEFRICQDHSWTTTYPTDNNYVYHLDAAGTYNVTITFDANTKAVNCIVEQVPSGPYATIYIDKTSVESSIYAFDSKDYYVEWPGVALSSLETAQVGGSDYYVYNFNHEDANSPCVIFSDGTHQTADIHVQDGDILKYLGGNKYVVNGVNHPIYYLIGDFNGWNDTTKVAFTPGEVGYELTYTFSGKFKIMDDNTWLGGETEDEGDLLVTQENNIVALSTSGHDLFLEGNDAEYNLYIENNVLTVNFLGTPSVPGDANCDGKVDVNDVTTTINYILGKDPTPFSLTNANVNNDEGVDVMDVTLIINIILGVVAD